MECWANRQGRCTILTEPKCDPAGCVFCKSAATKAQELEQANQRLRALPYGDQIYIAAKYYNGIKVWLRRK